MEKNPCENVLWLIVVLSYPNSYMEQIYLPDSIIQGVPKRSLNHAVHTDAQLESEEVEQLKLQLDQQKEEFTQHGYIIKKKNGV